MPKITKPRPTMSRAENARLLGLAFRRAILKGRAREEKAAAKAETVAQARHQRAMRRREGTNKLAAERMEACQRYPSPHAARQLASIAGREDLRDHVRVEAAAVLLDWGHADDVDPMAVAAAKRDAKPRTRRPKVRVMADRLRERG